MKPLFLSDPTPQVGRKGFAQFGELKGRAIPTVKIDLALHTVSTHNFHKITR